MLGPNTIKVLVAGLAALAAAHLGHEEHVADPAVKRSFLEQSRRSLDSCTHQLERRGTTNEVEARRKAMLKI